MYTVGLTGGIGSGKSTVAQLFGALGAPVIDADVIAREVVVPGSPCLQKIVHEFGRSVLNADGSLDRAALRQLVLADPAKRRKLEAILHPPIRAEMWQRARASTTPYVILAIPLLVETEQYREVDRVLVVDAPEALQRQRIRDRDRLSEAHISALLAAQTSREQRLQHAHDVINNDKDIDALRAQVAALHANYLERARRQSESCQP